MFDQCKSLFDYVINEDSCFEVIIDDILVILPPMIPELTRGKFIQSQKKEEEEDNEEDSELRRN